MSVKVAAFKKLSPADDYACSVLEVKEWSKDFADLRIEFGTHKNFQVSPRCNQKLKIQGHVVATIAIDCQLKPSLFLYPIPVSRYPEKVKKEFTERVLETLKDWLNEKLDQETEIIGHEMIVIELHGGNFKTHILRYI
jgi:hypothetical protein